MMEERPIPSRAAKQRRLLREVNDRIFEISRDWGLDDAPISFRCECGCAGCAEVVSLVVDEYRSVRRRRDVFIGAPPHGAQARGRVVGKIARRAILLEWTPNPDGDGGSGSQAVRQLFARGAPALGRNR